MATNQDIIDAREQLDDIADLETALESLAALQAGGEPLEIFIKGGTESFNLNRLLGVLGSLNADQDAAEAAIQASILTLIGANEVSIGSVRKTLRDLVTAHAAEVAAT